MVVAKDLRRAGYVEYQERLKDCQVALQRTIYDSEGKKRYFINAFGYDFSKYIPSRRALEFTFEVTFFRNGLTFKVNLYAAETVEALEAFFDDVWTRLECDIDHNNN